MKVFRRSILLLFIVTSVAVPALAQNKQLTIDDIFDPQKRVNFSGSPLSPRWLKDGTHYLVVSRDRNAFPRLLKVNAVTGRSEPFYNAVKMEAAFAALAGLSKETARRLANQSSYQMNAAETAVLINHANDLFYYEFGNDRAVRVTHSPQEEVGEGFSPDGKFISFVRGGNLYVADLASQRERALTSDGGEKILNGRLDWVYQEELYGRGNFGAYWWSPDSTRIAFLRIDENPVPNFPVVDHIPVGQNLENTPYPKAGDPNPLVKLGVVHAGGGDISWVDTNKYMPEDLLIVRVGWFPDGKKVWYQAQNRIQSYLDLNTANPDNGSSTNLFRETSKAWVEVVDEGLRWLNNGSFLWLSSRDGWHHIYHYGADGKLIRQVTKGEWDVRTLDEIDEGKGTLYFTGTQHSYIANHVYSIKLDGTGLNRLTNTEGMHRPAFNSSATHFIDNWSDVNTPTQVRLYDSAGRLVRVIDENKVDALAQYKLGKVEFLNVKTRDGFTMEAMMIKPPNFDPSKKYPVWSYTYAGPQAPQVRNAWGGTTFMWHQMMAQKGYLIWICDNRTASNKGVASAWPLYKNMGELELRDIEDGFAWLKAQPYVDGSRIGIWGWSYGGYMTSYALTHSQTFKIGIAGGSVTDWRNYDTIYTERYMDTPQNNPEGYRKTAPLHAARNLHGKLLLIHGAIDDNVHMSNTIQFLYELQKAGKDVQLMLYPKSRHGVTDPLLLKHMRQMMTDYVLANL